MPYIEDDERVTPYWTSACGNHEFFHGDSESTLSMMDARSVHCIVTSPPYWPLRDYGTPEEIGQEKSLQTYLDRLCDVGRELRRVLRNDGTFWLNLGDSRIGAKPGTQNSLPWRVAFALEKSGWLLRQDIIWSKSNPIPDGSCRDRCTKAHEYIFLFVKQKDYYFDVERLKNDTGSLPRTVWDLPPQREKGMLHKAVFPKELVRRCLAAGTSLEGCCAKCGSPYVRQIKKVGGVKNQDYTRDDSFRWSRQGVCGSLDGTPKEVVTLGWKPACRCGTDEAIVKKPCLVLDPFSGAGTTALVAASMGLRSIGIELNEKYIQGDAIRRFEESL